MKIQEPNAEFVAIDRDDMLTDSAGQETHMCGGSKYQPDPDECSADPSMF